MIAHCLAKKREEKRLTTETQRHREEGGTRKDFSSRKKGKSDSDVPLFGRLRTSRAWGVFDVRCEGTASPKDSEAVAQQRFLNKKSFTALPRRAKSPSVLEDTVVQTGPLVFIEIAAVVASGRQPQQERFVLRRLNFLPDWIKTETRKFLTRTPPMSTDENCGIRSFDNALASCRANQNACGRPRRVMLQDPLQSVRESHADQY